MLQSQGKWYQIEVAADQYVGWIDQLQHTPVTPEYFAAWNAQDHPRVLDVVQTVSDADARIPVLLGSRLPFFDGMTLQLGARTLFFNGAATNPAAPPEPARQVQLLRKMGLLYLSAPYLWGGKSMFGVDCSGLVQQLYGLVGVPLRRDACQQIEHGQPVDFVTQSRLGDLAFFDNAEGRIVHVGMVLDDGLILHASGEVRLDPLDHNGIYNRGRQVYSHKLRLIKRLLSE